MKIFDTHGDIFFDVHRKGINGETEVINNFHLERLKKGEVFGGIFVVWLPEKNSLGEVYSKEESKKIFLEMVEAVEKEESFLEETCEIITKKSQIDSIFKNEKIWFLKGIEGLRVVEDNLELLDILYKKGYRHCGLTWNEENNLATGARGSENRGLTDLGRDAIKKMETLGMVVDVSHLNEKSFWDIIEVAKKPIIASHSGARTLCDHVRNLTDDQIKAVSNNRGVIGVNAYRSFLHLEEEKRDVERYVDHIEHIIKIGGIDSVALGFDFCEYLPTEKDGKYTKGLKDASESQNVITLLKERGYNEEEIEKIAYKNILRIFQENLRD